jgi:hypothetical protein
MESRDLKTGNQTLHDSISFSSPRGISSTTIQLDLPLNTLPSRRKAQEKGNTSTRNRNRKRHPQPIHIRIENPWNLRLRKHMPEIRGARRDHEARIHGRNFRGQRVQEFIREAGLGGGDEDGAADGLEEEDDGADGAEVAGFDDGLADDDGDLEDKA